MAAPGAAHDGGVRSASPTYRQCTRSRLVIVGTGWKVTGPLPAVSRSLSGSVVQYMYQVRACVPTPRTTVGSAQLSTVPRPGMAGASGLWYVARGVTDRAAAAPAAGRAASARTVASKPTSTETYRT